MNFSNEAAGKCNVEREWECRVSPSKEGRKTGKTEHVYMKVCNNYIQKVL